MTRPQNRKCDDGCTCAKHRKRECAPGCLCSRHRPEWKYRECPEGCTCGRHRSQACEPGCTCARHGAQSNRKHTEEQAAAARERKLARGREYQRERWWSDPEGMRARNKAYQSSANRRKWFLKHKFNITVEQWDAMVIEQRASCYLCGDLLNGNIHIDHNRACCPGDRSCGKCVRGIACQLCNQGIGQFGDDPERMRRVADNLEAANARLATR